MSKFVNVLGIDQGIANIGYAVINHLPFAPKMIVVSGVLRTKSTDSLEVRLSIIFNHVKALIETYNIKAIGCEKLFFNQKQQERNKSASMMTTNMATGVIYLLAGIFSLPIYEFVPGTIKKAVTGSGRATKEEVMEKIQGVLPEPLKKNEEHRADAIGIGLATREKLTKGGDV